VLSADLRKQFSPAHADSEEPFPDRLRNELVRWQTATQLPEFLRYADRNSMAFSREVRLPFLDHRLVEYCFGLPPDLLLRNAVTKVTLREAMRGIVPAEILRRKDKVAYAPPQKQWIHGPLRPWMEEKLRAAEGRTDVFTPRTVIELRERLGKSGRETMAWRVASTEAWFQTMIDQRGRASISRPEISALSW
jgi:asparagine synthase (glutamine-hydrolysing)